MGLIPEAWPLISCYEGWIIVRMLSSERNEGINMLRLVLYRTVSIKIQVIFGRRPSSSTSCVWLLLRNYLRSSFQHLPLRPALTIISHYQLFELRCIPVPLILLNIFFRPLVVVIDDLISDHAGVYFQIHHH